MNRTFTTLMSAFVAFVAITVFSVSEAQAGDCPFCETLLTVHTGPAWDKCVEEHCSDGGGGGGGGGGVNWCKRLETCQKALTPLLPDCIDGEGDEAKLPFFTGEKANCKAEAKLCKSLSAKDVVVTVNGLCANSGPDMVSCAYTGTEVPAEACPEGCPNWYDFIQGDEENASYCSETECKPICAQDVLKALEPLQTALTDLGTKIDEQDKIIVAQGKQITAQGKAIVALSKKVSAGQRPWTADPRFWIIVAMLALGFGFMILRKRS